MNLNSLFALYEDFDFDVVFDTDSENDLSSASKLETIKYVDDKQLDTFIKDNFKSKSEFNKFLIEFFDTQLYNSLNAKFKTLLKEITSFNEFKKFGQGVHTLDKLDFQFSTIEYIKLPDSINYIGNYEFRESNLKEIEIPKNLEIIYNKTFYKCQQLKTVICSTRNPEDLKNYSYNAYIGSDAFCNCPKLETVDLSNFIGLERIYTSAFNSCNIKTLKLPNSLVSLDELAFYKNPLETLDLSNTIIEKIGYNCFDCCQFLKEVKFPKTIKHIGSSAFKDTALKEVHIPKYAKFDETSFPKGCHVVRDL